MKKIKILFYSGHCETIGGDAKYLFDLINNLNHEKYDIELLTDKNHIFKKYANESLSNNIRIKYLDTRPALFKKSRAYPTLYRILSFANLRFGIHNFLIFYNLFKEYEEKIDIFHFNNGGYPGKRAGQIAVIVARLCGIKKIIMSIHNLPLKRKRYVFLDYFFDILISKFCKKVIIASRNLRKEIIARRGFSSSQVIAIPCGLEDIRRFSDEECINIKKELRLELDRPILSITAHMDYEMKGHKVLFKSLIETKNKYPNISLLVIGDGRKREELQGLSSFYNLMDNIIFLGYRRDIDRINSIIDIAIVPSLGFEAIPYTIKEAMRAGKPVVATDTGGCNEAVEDNVNGLLVAKNNVEMLTKAILQLLETKSLRLKMGNAGRKIFVRKFLLSDKISAHEGIYEQLLTEEI